MKTGPIVTRRRAIGVASTMLGAVVLGAARRSGAQPQVSGQPETAPEAPGGTMEGDGYLPVRRAAKAGAQPSMTATQRDDLEHLLSCPCPCTLDVFTCRTSMPCGFSPRMHGDVKRLVEGGYSADEIIAAFTDTYGEQVLMAPKREGFNWVGYLAPFAALGGGAVVVASLIRRWGARAAAAPRPTLVDRGVDASPDELARLEAAVRNEER